MVQGPLPCLPPSPPPSPRPPLPGWMWWGALRGGVGVVLGWLTCLPACRWRWLWLACGRRVSGALLLPGPRQSGWGCWAERSGQSGGRPPSPAHQRRLRWAWTAPLLPRRSPWPRAPSARRLHASHLCRVLERSHVALPAHAVPPSASFPPALRRLPLSNLSGALVVAFKEWARRIIHVLSLSRVNGFLSFFFSPIFFLNEQIYQVCKAA